MKIILYKKIIISVLLFVFSATVDAQAIINEDFLDNIEENAKALWLENILHLHPM
jgi:hypothetical protein